MNSVTNIKNSRIFTYQLNNTAMDAIAIKKDITEEAKRILAPAMRGFCKPARVKSEMELWIEDRTMEIRINTGIDEPEAKEQAIKEWEGCKD